MRYWTVEEANAALPRIAARVEHARDIAGRLRDRAKDLREHTPGNGHGPWPGTLRSQLREIAAALAADGVVLRDPNRGLVDFPARAADGRSYWLCWLADEEEVAWWHWPEEGFAGRRPLEEQP